ncbi:MAG: hypothetical protein ACI3V4_07020 [Faecousia sp.]
MKKVFGQSDTNEMSRFVCNLQKKKVRKKLLDRKTGSCYLYIRCNVSRAKKPEETGDYSPKPADYAERCEKTVKQALRKEAQSEKARCKMKQPI